MFNKDAKKANTPSWSTNKRLVVTNENKLNSDRMPHQRTAAGGLINSVIQVEKSNLKS